MQLMATQATVLKCKGFMQNFEKSMFGHLEKSDDYIHSAFKAKTEIFKKIS